MDTNRSNEASTAIRVRFKKITKAKTDFAHPKQQLDITWRNAKRNKFVATVSARCGGGAPLAAQVCVCHGASSRRGARNRRRRSRPEKFAQKRVGPGARAKCRSVRMSRAP